MIVSGSTLSNEMGILSEVNIQVVGENRSITSDNNGRFAISVNGPSSVLRFTHAGYDYDEISANEFNVLGYILLFPTSLDEVEIINTTKPKEDNSLLVVLSIAAAFFIGKAFSSSNSKAKAVKA